VFWVFGLALMLGLYSAFVVPPILFWNSAPLIVFMAIHYALFLPVIYDYFVLTCTDPVDPNIITMPGPSTGETKECSICHVNVGKDTEHCLNCHRCTDQLDHHSQLINNCISLKNFSNYLRMNICFCLANLIMMVESAVIFGATMLNASIGNYVINQWVICLLMVLSFITFVFSLANSIFSCYVRYYKHTTRLKYRFRETESNNSDLSDSEELSDKSKSNEKNKSEIKSNAQIIQH
jgi:hypothetical protein